MKSLQRAVRQLQSTRTRLRSKLWKQTLLRITTTPQRGSNCRHAALRNVTRSAREWSDSELQALFHALVREHYPDQHVAPRAVAWTLNVFGNASLMVAAIESRLPHCVAAMLMASQLQEFQTLCGQPLHKLLQQDADTPGLLYFSKTHCMSCLHNGGGKWWNVPQSRAIPTTVQQVARTVATHTGTVLVWSARFAKTHIFPRLCETLSRSSPWLPMALRWGFRTATNRRAEHVAWYRFAQQQPEPKWTTEHRRQLVFVAKQWLSM
jgi:hypothetical protein